jgi:uncharacterized membrane-anchored protein YitT (DUF2179 family)
VNRIKQKFAQHRLSSLVIVRRMVFMTLGAALVAAGLQMLIIPNLLIDGGIVGIAIMLAYLSHVKLGIVIWALNLPFLILGYKQIGKTFALSTLYSVSILSIFTALWKLPVPTTDPLLAAVFGGIIIGGGVGLVIRYGGSLDGSEIVSLVLNKKLGFSVGELVMFINIFILSSAGFLFGWDRAMYSLIAYYISIKMIDLVIEGLDESKAVWIISEHSLVIGDQILARLGRGVTYLEGQGGFSGDPKKVLFCVINRLEQAKLKTITEEADPQAFLAIGNIHDVKGGRFQKRSIH